MAQPRPEAAYRLSLAVAALAAMASAGGLLIPGLYRDNPLITAAWKGNDLITLVVSVPLLAASTRYARLGDARALLLWLGSLLYMLYNYIFYLYGAAFNVFFLVYVALFTSSAFALILGLAGLDAGGIAGRFRQQTPVKPVAGFMVFFGLLLGGMWVAMSLGFLVTGEVPQAITQTGHPTGVVFATDLSILVPALVLGGVMLWRRRPWGYVLGAMVMVKAASYGLALLAMSAFAYSEVGAVDPFALLFGALAAGCLVSCAALLWNVR